MLYNGFYIEFSLNSACSYAHMMTSVVDGRPGLWLEPAFLPAPAFASTVQILPCTYPSISCAL